MNYNFDEILEKKCEAIKYKRENYYTNYYNHIIDQYDYTQEVVEVEDWEGRKGRMTYRDFARYIGVTYETLIKYLHDYISTDEISIKFRNTLKKYFKRVHIAEVK